MAILLHPAELSFPSSAQELFGRSGPLVVEIGFGNGDFLCRLAEGRPDWNLIGAETSPSSVMRAYRRITCRGLTNVKILAASGQFVLRNVVPDGSLDRLFVNFPDPWPRRRHHERRLLSRSFLEILAARLRKGGHLALTTDHEDYLRFAEKNAAATKLYAFETDPAPLDVLDTRWARRWIENGRAIYHTRFKKTSEPQSLSPRIRTTDMQHSLLRGSLEGIEGFERFVVQRDGVHVIVTDAFRQIADDAVIFPTIVEENDLRQYVLIEAYPRGNEILVGVKRFGHPLSTPGINIAVESVAELLERQGLELLERAYGRTSPQPPKVARSQHVSRIEEEPG